MDLGVYVHIPFCATRCDYCDFATWTDRGHLVADYVDACITDIEHQFSRDLRSATSVFFGGGTPSLLPATAISRILAAIPRARDAEVTVECNPDSVDQAKLSAYAHAGVRRLSFGVQSMRTHVLAALGRTHDPANVDRAVRWARAEGFDDVNLDLIYGTPGESRADWQATIAGALPLHPSHVSAYALTVEPATPLGRRVRDGSALPPDDDDQAAKYEIVDDALSAAGYEWYEISNWSRPGRTCRHNELYWAQGEYVAIGCAAHGHAGGRRWWNVRTPERYIDAIGRGSSPVAGEEHLDATAAEAEQFGLALRTRRGAVPLRGCGDVVSELSAAGLLVPVADRVVLTRRGRLLASDVTARFLAATERHGSALALGRLEC